MDFSFLFIVFFTSLAAMGAMIYYQWWEIEHGRAAISPHDGEKPFFSIEEMKEEVQKCYNCIPRENIHSFFNKTREWGTHIGLAILTRVETMSIKKRIHSIIDDVRGRREMNTNGKPASPFIKDILAHRENFRQRESEEGKKLNS
ncbi:MAG: hypothetical protein Q8R36_04585 [bacterium]|nr:hypothetical protein [bacterium]